MNINDEIEIVPNGETERAWRAYERRHGLPSSPVRTRLQLWEWAQIFGESLALGLMPPHGTEIKIVRAQ